MNLLQSFEKLSLNKSLKLTYEAHDVFYLKYDSNKRIGIRFNNVDVESSGAKKFRGFYTKARKEEKEFHIQTEGNLAEREIFCLMCEFILKDIQKLKNLDSKDIEDAIKDWVNFGKTNQNNLPESIQLGLYGELLFLQFIRNHLNEKDAIIAWHGPDRKKVDFVFSENLAAEIKAISDPLNPNISISSVKQLSDGYKNHFLRVYKLVVTPNGKKLDKFFDEVLQIFSGEEKDKLISKCCDYGFNYLLEYDNLKPISNLGFNDYFVTDKNFPTLLGEFDPRIIEIKYKISLENQSPSEPGYLEKLIKTSSKS